MTIIHFFDQTKSIKNYNMQVASWPTSSDWYNDFAPLVTAENKCKGVEWDANTTLTFDIQSVDNGDTIFFNTFWNNDGTLDDITVTGIEIYVTD